MTHVARGRGHRGAEGQTLRTSIIDEWSAVWGLQAEWNAVLSRSRADTIFLTWEWIWSWVEAVGRAFSPLVVTVRDADGMLVGVAPFYVTESRLVGLVPYRILWIMADHATGAEYPDWIVRRDCEAEAAGAIARALREAGHRWDCIWMPNVAGWTGARDRLLDACAQEDFYSQVRPRDFGLVDLPGDMATYRRSLSSNKRESLRAQTKRTMARDDVAITRCTARADLPRFLEALFELHHRRWRQRGEEGTFRRKPCEERFYRRFTPVALDRGWLSLFGLEERGEFKAVQIGYVYDGVFHVMQEGFDPEYVSGVGNVLRAKIIEACIADGVRGIDFLGGMTEHKRRWRAKERMGHDVFIGRPSLKNRILFDNAIWPTGRFLRPSSRSVPEAPRSSEPRRPSIEHGHMTAAGTGAGVDR